MSCGECRYAAVRKLRFSIASKGMPSPLSIKGSTSIERDRPYPYREANRESHAKLELILNSSDTLAVLAIMSSISTSGFCRVLP